jgi:hypothetical protein
MPLLGREAGEPEPGFDPEVVTKAVQIVHERFQTMDVSWCVGEHGGPSSYRAAEGYLLVRMLLETATMNTETLVTILVDKYQLTETDSRHEVRLAQEHAAEASRPSRF